MKKKGFLYGGVLCAVFTGLYFSGILDEKATITVEKGCLVEFADVRPDIADTNIIACIPAAYSGEGHIIGHYSTGNGRQGVTSYDYTTIHLDGKTHFQQASLVRDHVPRTFDDPRHRYRRALCLKDGQYHIVHSKYPVTLTRFARQLTSHDMAWNLDMGTYSYGWVRKSGVIHHLGISTIWNRGKQTNWIVIKKK